MTDDIWVKSDYKSKRITGPVGTKCCKVVTGEVKVDHAYIKATLDEKMGEHHQDVIDYITTAIDTTGKPQGSIQAASYLGAGFGITFTPSVNAKKCCTKIYWAQRFIEDGQYYVPGIVTYLGDGIGGVDYETSRATAVDFPGDTVNGFFDRDFGRSFLLTLFCDKQDMFAFTWSYQVKYDSTRKSATVTLDLPF